MRLVIVGFLICCFSGANGQTYIERESEHERANFIYVGIQTNQLIRQIFNFGGSSAINNPYLLTLGINSKTSGWGMNLSHGFTYKKENDGDQVTKRETTVNQNFFRIGFEKKSFVAEKLMISWGFDAVLDLVNDKTKTINDFGGGNNSTVETGLKRRAGGLGPRVAINYQLGKSILVGTECNYYFKSGKDTEIFKTFVNSTPGELREEDQKFRSFEFTPPAVIFLILKM